MEVGVKHQAVPQRRTLLGFTRSYRRCRASTSMALSDGISAKLMPSFFCGAEVPLTGWFVCSWGEMQPVCWNYCFERERSSWYIPKTWTPNCPISVPFSQLVMDKWEYLVYWDLEATMAVNKTYISRWIVQCISQISIYFYRDVSLDGWNLYRDVFRPNEMTLSVSDSGCQGQGSSSPWSRSPGRFLESACSRNCTYKTSVGASFWVAELTPKNAVKSIH